MVQFRYTLKLKSQKLKVNVDKQLNMTGCVGSTENAGTKNAGQKCIGGKCRTGKCETNFTA